MSALTRLAHTILSEILQSGDVAVDLTAGNGFDTLFLAQKVAPTGCVYAFDIQSMAIAATRARLAEKGLDSVARLHQASHEEWQVFVPQEDRSRLRVAMMNLGYLPGGDTSIVTETASSLAALETAVRLLFPGGLLSVLAYTGHPGGLDEAKAVRGLFDKLQLDEEIAFQQHPEVPIPNAPILMLAIKKARVHDKVA